MADDGIDQDCDGTDTVTCFVDGDGDGAGGATTVLAADGDCDDPGETSSSGDSDDALASACPGAPEVADDGVDQNCDGVDTITCYVDGDGDSVGGSATVLAPDGDCADPGEAAVPGDCDDNSASVYPGAPEAPDDGIDQDCNGTDAVTCFQDADGDGFGSGLTVLGTDGDCTDPGESTQSSDCDDTLASVNPGGAEVVGDGIDQDCNGTDTITCFFDNDGDTVGGTSTITAADGDCTDPGESALSTDCNDASSTVFPGAPEVCDAIDQDCDGDLVEGFSDTDGDLTPNCADADDDGDGVGDSADCGPLNNSVYPGAVEICDNIDQDCDGDLLEGFDDLNANGVPDCIDGDLDADGVSGAADCDDTDPSVYPGAPEVPDDGVDQDCDGNDTVNCFVDADADGVGSTATVLAPDGDCTGPGESSVFGDCDDGDPAIFPGAPEIGNDGIDQDCNGDDTVTCYVDADGDGVGSAATFLASDGDCTDANESSLGTDCADGNAAIYPGATELCDGTDQDCDGGPDDGFADTDGDGAADCIDPDDDGDFFPDQVDCAPTDGAIYPNAPEACDAIDSDCDGDLVDEFDDIDDDGTPDCIDTAIDDDGDGVPVELDCDDTDPESYPGATEVLDDGIDQDCDGLPEDCADGLDGDCDGLIDDADADCNGLIDADGDGWCLDGADANGDGDCSDPGEALEDGEPGDCDDNDPARSPSADELCDGIDSDCVPDDLETDRDGDGLWPCEGDCDDASADVSPERGEICGDGIDQDCDGTETADHDDPDCWETGCSVGSVRADGWPALLALLLLIPLRRRRLDPRWFGLLAAPLLMGASDARIQSIDAAISGGRCSDALDQARLVAQDAPEDPHAARLVGDAARCLGRARESVTAYRRVQELGAGDAALDALIVQLVGILGQVTVVLEQGDAPELPWVRLRIDDPEEPQLVTVEAATPGTILFPDLEADTPMTLVLGGRGLLRAEIPVPALTPGETREVVAQATWAGFGRLELTQTQQDVMVSAEERQRAALRQGCGPARGSSARSPA